MDEDGAAGAQGQDDYGRNVLWMMLFVAAQGVVPLSELREFEAALPEDAWGTALPPDGRHDLRRWLAWAERVRPERRVVRLDAILRELVNGVAKRTDTVRSVDALLRAAEHPLLAQEVSLPVVDLSMRLSEGLSALKGMRAALALCDDAEAVASVSSVIDVETARDTLRAHLASMSARREQTFEVRGDLPGFARGLLVLGEAGVAALSSVRLLVAFSVAGQQPVHRIHVRSPLRKADLASRLGVAAARLALDRSNFPAEEFLSVEASTAALRRAAASRPSPRFGG